MKKLTKRDFFQDKRDSEEIDVSKEPDMYYAKLAYEYYGDATRDNTFDDMVWLGMKVEREHE